MTKYIPFVLALVIGVLITALLMKAREQSASSLPAPSGEYARQTPAKLLPIGPDEANCPVMGMVGKKVEMVKVIEQGTMYYLCCQECVPKFHADPERYIKYPAPPTEEICK